MSTPAERSAGLVVREATAEDRTTVWQILEPVIRAGEAYALPRDMSEQGALDYWFGGGRRVYVAVDGDRVLGTYFLTANQKGGGAHVANSGYVTADHARGRGVAGVMAEHSLGEARALGFLAMQYNFVIVSNEGAVRLWQRLGFETVGRLPKAFRHPAAGLVDVLIMHRFL